MKKTSAFSRQRRLILSLQVAIISLAIVLMLWANDLFAQTQFRLTNLLYLPKETSGKIVIVAIDDDSLQAYGRTPAEWSRQLHADLVKIVNEGGARVIAFDILLSEATPDDDALAAAIEEARASRTATRTIMPVVGLQPQQNPSAILSFAELRLPTETLAATSEYFGAVNNVADADNTTRQIAMRITDGQESYYAFSLATYLAYVRIPPLAVSQVLQFEEMTLRLPSQEVIPLNERDQMMLNFFDAPNKGAFEVYSYQQVIDGAVDPAVFDDKIVLVGLMNSIGQTDNYLVPTSINGAQMAGVEIHANAIETILQDLALRPQSRQSQMTMLIILAVLASVIYGQLPRPYLGLWLLIAAVMGVVVGVVAATFVFTTWLQVVNVFYMLLAIALPAPIALAQHASIEFRQHQQLALLLDSIVNASSQEMSLELVLPGIAADLCTILECDHAEIWLWSENLLTCAQLYPHNSPSHESFAQTTLEARQLHLQNQMLGIPLIWHDKPQGVLIASPVKALRRRKSEMLHLFSWQTAAVITNIRLFSETRQLSELKTFLIRMASHDLKNPLMGILSYSQFLLEDNKKKQFLDETQLGLFEEIGQAANEMRSIINDILDLERVRSGTKKAEHYDVVELLQELLQRYLTRIQQKKLTLHSQLPGQAILLLGDREQINLAFSNLISNALKYTPEGGSITVACALQPGQVQIEIKDTGYGISEEGQKNLFREFYRVKTEETRTIEGTGLGLSLVKTIIESHGGHVGVTSKKGAGSIFIVTLPLYYRQKVNWEVAT